MYTLILLGMTIVSFGIIMLLQPQACFEFGRKYFFTSSFQYGCSIAGLLLGVALFFSSFASKYSNLFEIIGIGSLLGAVVCLVLPSSVFRSIISWEIKTFSPYSRLLAASYFAIGGFTVYAAL